MRAHTFPSSQRASWLCLWLCTALLLSLPEASTRAEELRLPIKCTINGKPALFIIDTGASDTTLSRDAAKRLGLKIVPLEKQPLTDGDVHVDKSEECTVAFEGNTPERRFFYVTAIAAFWSDFHQVDGILSWRDLDTNSYLVDQSRFFCGSVPLPSDLSSWTQWKIVPDEKLVFERTEEGRTVRIGVDTGDSGGVLLNKAEWAKWVAAHPGQPQTGDLMWSMASGNHTQYCVCAEKFDLGKLSFADVPVSVKAPREGEDFDQCDAVLGLFALSRVKVLIDSKDGFVYTEPVQYPEQTFDYNRLGAVFEDGNLANVMKGSPAEEAGILDGDQLLKINGADAGASLLWQYWSQPAGTRVHLVILRGKVEREFDVTLQEPGFSAWLSAPPEGNLEAKGDAAYVAGDYDIAATCYTELIQSGRGNAKLFFRRGAARVETDDNAGALKDLNEAIRLKPENLAQCLYRRSQALYNTGDRVKAMVDCNGSIRLNPVFADAYRTRGLFYRNSAQAAESLKDFTRAIQLDPAPGDTWYNRSQMLLFLGDTNAALADAEVYVRFYPGRSNSYANRGSVHESKGEWSQAIADYENAIRIDPKDANTHVSLAALLATCPDPAARNAKKALAEASEAGKLSGWKDASSNSVMAAASAAAGDFAQAVKFQKQALAAPDMDDFDRIGARRRLALYQQGKAVWMPVQETAMQYRKGLAAIGSGDYGQAIQFFTAVLANDPRDGLSYSYRGSALSHRGEFKKALEDYEKDIDLGAGLPNSYNSAAWLLATNPDATLRDGAKAVIYAKKACEMTEEKDASHLDTLAAAYAEAGDFKQAANVESDAVTLQGLVNADGAKFMGRVVLYLQGKPYREETKK